MTLLCEGDVDRLTALDFPDEVRDNTSKNAGGAAAPGDPEKEKLSGRIKDKLPFGHHKE